MDLQKFANTRLGVALGLALGKVIPPQTGYALANWLATLLSRRNSSGMVAAVRSNQWVIRGENLSSVELDAAVQEVFSHAGRCFIDLYQNLKNPDGMKALVKDNPKVQELIQHSQNRSFGAFIVVSHLSNFDLCLLAFAYRGLHGQILTYGQPTGGYEIQNEIRSKTGLDITPVSPEVHNLAIENMRSGGLVITAVDRPIRRKAHYLTFFGRPCPLPAGHIRMAIQAGVPVMVASASMDETGFYHVHLSAPIEMQPHPDPDTEIKINGEAVLKIIEERIRKNPGQWLMYYPAWPDIHVEYEN